MLANWMRILPLFMVEWLARRYGERLTMTFSNGDTMLFNHGPNNVLFYVPKDSK